MLNNVLLCLLCLYLSCITRCTLMNEVDRFVDSKNWTDFASQFLFEYEKDTTLDAIVLTCTLSEMNAGKIEYFMSTLRPVSQSGLRPPLWIVSNVAFNSTDISRLYQFYLSMYLNKQFSGLHYLSLNLSAVDDTYTTASTTGKIGRLGNASGPNIMFYFVMRHFGALYRSILMLEWDCSFHKDYWFDDFYYLSKIETFWIIGSTYKGTIKLPPFILYHTNGVALYNVRNRSFQRYLNMLESFHEQASGNYPWLAFDIVLSVFLSEFLGPSKDYYRNSQYNSIIRYIQTLIINTNLIINISPKYDRKVPLPQIFRRYPKAIIIHQKGGLFAEDDSTMKSILREAAIQKKREEQKMQDMMSEEHQIMKQRIARQSRQRNKIKANVDGKVRRQ